MATKRVEELVDQIMSMTPAEKLRVAAGLLDLGKPETAETIVDQVSAELRATRLFGKVAK